MRPRTRPTHLRHRRILGAFLAAGLLLSACAAQDAVAPVDSAPTTGPGERIEPLLVVATTSILGDIVANLVAEDGTVTVLMAPGVDPHGYQASAADAAAMRDADLVLANGLLLEEGLISALDAAAAEGVRVLTVADKLDPIAFGGGHDAHGDDGEHDKDDDHGHRHDHSHGDDHDDDHGDDHGDDHDGEGEHDHEHGDEDPHFWWDPIRAALAVELIAAELASIRPGIDWDARAERYTAELLSVHEEMLALFAAIPEERRRIVTNHDSLGYLEARYGFEVIGTVIPGSSTSVEANPRAFAQLVDLLVAEGVTVVFAENTDSVTLAEQLAAEVVGRGRLEVTVVRILTDALGPEGSGADTYVGMLRTTATLIHAALAA
jgi:zinc/manganese transport system substrate-binding protein